MLLKPNPKLFKQEERPNGSQGRFFAFVDSVEQSDNLIYLKLDCIDYEKVKNSDINIESNENQSFASDVFYIQTTKQKLKQYLNYSNLYNLESQWIFFVSEKEKEGISFSRFYNLEAYNEARPSNITSFLTYSQISDADIKKIIKQLQVFSSMDSIPKIDLKSLVRFERFVVKRGTRLNVGVFNVGQGNCCGVFNGRNPILYFDVGGGANQNRRTYPIRFRLRLRNKPLVFLSHWDQDHFQTALYDDRLLDLQWIVPKQKLSNTAKRLVVELVKRRNIWMWDDTISDYTGKYLSIVKCQGSINSKNNSGLAMFVKNNLTNDIVLMPGDSGYSFIPKLSNYPLFGLVASHHGARLRNQLYPKPRNNVKNKLIYSYGFKNTFHHPHSESISGHKNAGWNPSKTFHTPKGGVSFFNPFFPLKHFPATFYWNQLTQI